MKIIFVFFFIISLACPLQAQKQIYQLGSEKIEFELDTIEFDITPINGETIFARWYQADENFLFLLDEFDHTIQKLSFASHTSQTLYCETPDYDFVKGIDLSNEFLIANFSHYPKDKVVLYIYDKTLQLKARKKLVYRKLQKPQKPGYSLGNGLKVWIQDDKIIIPLEHRKLPDSIRIKRPLFGVFNFTRKRTLRMNSTFGFIPAENQQDWFSFERYDDKIVVNYNNTAIQVFDLSGKQIMYVPGFTDHSFKCYGRCQYLPEKDIYICRYQKVTQEMINKNNKQPITDRSKYLNAGYDGPYWIKVIKNTKNPEIVFDGMYESPAIHFLRRAPNEYYNVLYESGKKLRVVLYHLR